MPNIALPYRIPHSDRVVASPWLLSINQTERGELPREFPAWDYNTDLRISRRLELDLPTIFAECELPNSTALIATVVWESSGSRQRQRAFHQPIEARSLVEIDCTLLGSEIGGTLTITTIVCLAETRTTPTAPFTAHMAGSVLWSESTVVRLEDEAPQFPIAIIDFALTNLPEKSAWFVQIANDLDTAAMGSLLLCINQSNATVASAFENASSASEDQRSTIRSVHADVARQLIEHALSDDDFDHGVDYPDESLGRMLQSLIQRLFPDQEIQDLRVRRNTLPTLFSAEVQDAIRITGGVE